MIKFLHSITLIFCVICVVHGQSRRFLNFVNDTTFIMLPDTTTLNNQDNSFIIDNRLAGGHFLSVSQKSKWLIVPVDQYLLFKHPLTHILSSRLGDDLILDEGQKLVVDNLYYWYNSSAFLRKGNFLNGYTRLVDSTGSTICDWQWEIKESKGEKEQSKRVGLLINHWIEEQKKVLQTSSSQRQISPFPYRRQLISWMDLIFLADGFIMDSRFTLDFPTDQRERFTRGASGIYYRRSSKHQSIGFGGYNQQRYFRYRESFLVHLNITGRLGFNNFDSSEFEYIDPWNIFMVNVGLTETIEYRPRYFKGIFAGIGLHQNINLLPEMIDSFEAGIVMTIGVCLP